MAKIRLVLDKRGAAAGGRLAGVVILTVEAPLAIRGVRVRLYGYKRTLRGAPRQGKDGVELVSQEIVLTGREPFRSRIEALADTWGCVLGRRRHPVFQPGEYAYPFAIDLPNGLPPTYVGPEREVRYFLMAYADIPGGICGRGLSMTEEITVISG